MGAKGWLRVVLALLCVSFVAPRTANAWYVPEHSEITRIALTHYAPAPTAEIFAEIVRLAKMGESYDEKNWWYNRALPLCPAPGLMLHETPLESCADDSPNRKLLPLDAGPMRCLTTPYARCIPYSVLPALAADHSLTIEELTVLMTKRVSRTPMPRLTVAGMVTGAAAQIWKEFRDSAPPDFTRVFASPPGNPNTPNLGQDAQINRTKVVRDLDARLLLVDHDYTARAMDNRTHFHDTAYSIPELLERLREKGTVDNALNQMLIHHMRSLTLMLEAAELAAKVSGASAQCKATAEGQAYVAFNDAKNACTGATCPTNKDCVDLSRLVRIGLLEHAFALHFMEDGFASGHMGTEHGLHFSDTRLKRHDYLCRVGLSVTRALAVEQCGNKTNDHCWTAFGDGHLDADNLPYVAGAVARMQLQFAAAFAYRETKSGDSISNNKDLLTEAWFGRSEGRAALNTKISSLAETINTNRKVINSLLNNEDLKANLVKAEWLDSTLKLVNDIETSVNAAVNELRDSELHKTANLAPDDERDFNDLVDQWQSYYWEIRSLRSAAQIESSTVIALLARVDALRIDSQNTKKSGPERKKAEQELPEVKKKADDAIRNTLDSWRWLKSVFANEVKGRELVASSLTEVGERASALLDPIPQWTWPPSDLDTAEQAARERRRKSEVVKNFVSALGHLRTKIADKSKLRLDDVGIHDWVVQTGVGPADGGNGAGAQENARLIANTLLDRPEDLCSSHAPIVTSNDEIEIDDALCPRTSSATSSPKKSTLSGDKQADYGYGSTERTLTQVRTPKYGQIDVSLWRPLLVVWPAARTDVRTIDGLDPFGRGMAYQVVLGGGGAWNASGQEVKSGLFSIGAGLGVSYRFDSLLAGRDNRSILEVNAGLAPLLALAPKPYYATLAFAELRIPVVTLLGIAVGYGTLSAYGVDPARAGWGIGVYGARMYFLLPGLSKQDASVDILGWDLEVAYVSLGNENRKRSASSSGLQMAPELRLRLGGLDEKGILKRIGTDDKTLSRINSGTSLMIGMELSTGFSWFFSSL